MRADIWNKVVAALAPDRGGVYLDRVMNLHGALDFRGQAGAEAWKMAVGAANWTAAAIIARHGYEPPGQEALSQYLIRHRLDACDLYGRPAAPRLWALLNQLSSSDDPGAVAFVLQMGGPWRGSHLNAGLFLAARSKKGAAQIRLVCEAGGQIDCRLEEVQAELLGEVGLSPNDLKGMSRNEREEFLALTEMDETLRMIALREHPGATPLILATASFGGGRLGPWIECGADVTATDGDGKTALHWACRGRAAETVSALLAEDSAGVNRPDIRGVRPIDVAMRFSDGRVLALLLAAGAHLPEAEADISSCEPGAILQLAVRAGVPLPKTPPGAAKLLASLPAMEDGLERSLFEAAEKCYSELVELLVTAGATPGYVDSAQRTCLHASASNADVRSVELLLAAGAAVNAIDANGDSPLLLACKAGDEDGLLTQALLADGADAQVADRRGGTCLHLLARSPVTARAAVNALVKAGADVNAVDSWGDAPLHEALRADRVDLAEALLATGANPDQLYRSALTPLGLCMTTQTVELLLAAKASVAARDPGVAMAALRQAAHGTEAVFAIVLRALRFPCALRSRSGETLLHQVAWSDESEDAVRVAAVIGYCPDVNGVDNEGVTPLMKAAKYGTGRAVERLLAAGANASRLDAAGRSAADHAASVGRWKLAEFLSSQRLAETG